MYSEMYVGCPVLLDLNSYVCTQGLKGTDTQTCNISGHRATYMQCISKVLIRCNFPVSDCRKLTRIHQDTLLHGHSLNVLRL